MFDDDDEGSVGSPVGFSFSMGTSGVGVQRHSGDREGTYTPHRRRLSARLNIQPLRPFSCEPSASGFVRSASRAMI